jgi:hypothetical protein
VKFYEGGCLCSTIECTANRLQVTAIRDLTDGYDSTTPDKKPKLPLNIGGEMITYTFEVGATITLRTSGTEPKIKFYCEMKVRVAAATGYFLYPHYRSFLKLLQGLWLIRPCARSHQAVRFTAFIPPLFAFCAHF